MKLHLITLLLLLSSHGFSQSLEKFRFDDHSFSVLLPKDIEEIDFEAFCLVQIFYGENLVVLTKWNIKNNAFSGKEINLPEFFENYKKGVRSKASGDFIEDKMIEIDGISFLKLKFPTVADGQPRLFEYYTTVINNLTYTIGFAFSADTEAGFSTVKKAILHSLKKE